jgi:hypothetical protein
LRLPLAPRQQSALQQRIDYVEQLVVVSSHWLLLQMQRAPHARTLRVDALPQVE